MGMISEFKEFAVKGNVVDMAVGVIIGGAFGKIVSSFVSDVVMPPIGLLLGGADFSNLAVVLKEDPAGKADVLLKYGAFINYCIDFFIIAFVIFLAVKAMNRLKKAEVPAAPTTKECPKCCSQVPLKAVKCPNCTSDLS